MALHTYWVHVIWVYVLTGSVLYPPQETATLYVADVSTVWFEADCGNVEKQLFKEIIFTVITTRPTEAVIGQGLSKSRAD